MHWIKRIFIKNSVKVLSVNNNKNQFPIKFNCDIFTLKEPVEVFDKIVDKTYDSVEFNDINEVSDQPIRNLCYLFDMHFQIQNGGIIQFIDNSSGNNFNETLKSLEIINLPIHIDILQKVKSVFPNNYVTKNWEERRLIIDRINENNVPQIAEFDPDIFWEKLDKIYYANSDSFYNSINTYVLNYANVNGTSRM